MTELVLAVDGGGSKTLAILVDRQGKVVDCAKGNGINPVDQPDWQAEARRVLSALQEDLTSVVCGCFGAPGYGEVPSVTAQQDAFFSSCAPGASVVENDVRLAFDGAFLKEPGILLLLGTGSMAWVSDGTLHHRIGGWNEIYSDEGSGHWIGREALGMVARHLDGRLNAPALSTALLRHLHISGPHTNEQLLTWVYNSPHRRSSIAGLAQQVIAQAVAGDNHAVALMDRAFAFQAEHVIAAQRIYGDVLPWAITGGVGNNPYVQHGLAKHLGTPSQKQLPPVGGGAWRAACSAGWAVDPTWIRQLQISLAERGVHS